MNKLYIAVLLALPLFSCSDSKEVLDLRQALTAKLADDSDLTDYKLNPADVADCIVSQIADNAVDIPGHPPRQQVFEAYAKFVSVKSPGDAQKAVDQYKDLFGGVKESQAAAMGVTEYIMDCMGQAIEKLAPEGQKHVPENGKPQDEAAQQKQPVTGQPAAQ
jgi:hypothetical protein